MSCRGYARAGATVSMRDMASVRSRCCQGLPANVAFHRCFAASRTGECCVSAGFGFRLRVQGCYCCQQLRLITVRTGCGPVSASMLLKLRRAGGAESPRGPVEGGTKLDQGVRAMSGCRNGSDDGIRLVPGDQNNVEQRPLPMTSRPSEYVACASPQILHRPCDMA